MLSTGCSPDRHSCAPRRQSGAQRSRMLPYLSLALCFELGSATLDASHTTPGRLAPRAVATQEILDVPNNIPQGLLEKGDCVIVLSSMTKAALGVAGRYGRGVMVECRSGKSFHGWSVAPPMYSRNGSDVSMHPAG
jgi:lipid-binding SYLF domain-containing protein